MEAEWDMDDRYAESFDSCRLLTVFQSSRMTMLAMHDIYTKLPIWAGADLLYNLLESDTTAIGLDVCAVKI